MNNGWKEINWIESKAIFGDQYWFDLFYDI